ncbi:SURF1 family protein [Hyphomicrobium sp.]|uniref:SURF1 family protein n=1 Tax=Hyphomicrobium sp. TaxID=82 RepID=UPI0025C559C1|nr:SURF1 family protein [Hyphomicrobium sp.]MCC7254014.1 SURF1 family protein [Hyphomicrobium sp.]
MTEGALQARSPAAVILIVIAALTSATLFGVLGVWQVKRLSWKLDLIERVERRVGADPVQAPGRDAWAHITAASSEYLKVRVTGRFLHDRETLVQAVTDLGSGYWVLTPFEKTQGFTMLVNRGFVSTERRDPMVRAAAATAGEATVTGLLRLTEPGGAFLRTNDPAGDRWYSRDVEAIAFARGLGETAPYFIDADATPNPGGWPVGGLTRVRFTNNHLVYAVTWFSLSLMALASGGYVIQDWRRRTHLGQGGPRRGRLESSDEFG